MIFGEGCELDQFNLSPLTNSNLRHLAPVMPRMTASYDDNTTFAEDEKGEPICFDWLRDRDGEAPSVRVQVTKAYVEKEWRLSWKEDAAVTQRFNAVKRQHVEAAVGAKLLPGTDYRVYTIE